MNRVNSKLDADIHSSSWNALDRDWRSMDGNLRQRAWDLRDEVMTRVRESHTMVYGEASEARL